MVKMIYLDKQCCVSNPPSIWNSSLNFILLCLFLGGLVCFQKRYYFLKFISIFSSKEHIVHDCHHLSQIAQSAREKEFGSQVWSLTRNLFNVNKGFSERNIQVVGMCNLM